MPASLQPRIFYGLNTNIISNAHYITDAEVLYPVGNVIAVHNIPQRRQNLIHLPGKNEINIISVTPNKKYVATCEVGEKPTISIYDLQTLKRKKLLGIPYDAPDVTNFTCMCFSFDNKYLAAVTGLPDQTMLYYNWEKGKVESSLKVGIPQNPLAVVELLACNPSDIGIVAIGGPQIFKFLTLSETVWRPYGFSKADNILICSMTWLNSDRLLLGTKDGRILYLENGDLKNVYKMTNTTSMNLRIREEYIIPASSSLMDFKQNTHWENNIRCLHAFSKGFAYAFGLRTIVFFEKDGQHKYVKRNIYTIPLQVSKDDNEDLYQVNTININISLDRLIITTSWPQLFYARLWGPDLNVDPEPQKLKVMGQALHHGPISNLSMCTWKSVFMTCGELDNSVRLWDFETGKLILLKQYTEDICGISLHPTGLFCLIGFSDKLRFLSILIDDLLPMEEFPIRCCKTVTFSHGGHLFAAVNGNIVQVYTTIGFVSYFILKGHTNRVKALLWSQTDTKLLTLGTEGAIYQWSMSTGRRSAEIILRVLNLYDIALSADESSLYCIANDTFIHEIKDSTMVREYNLSELIMHSMVLGKEDQVLFLVCSGGTIVSVKCPLQQPVHYVDFKIHSVDITKIALCYNEQFLVSTGIDGSLCIWKVYYPEGKGTIGKEIVYTNEVLISKGDLEEKIQTIDGLNVRMRELETEHAYKMRQIEVQHNDKVRDLHQGYCEAIEELRDKISRKQEDHKSELNAINAEIVTMKENHEETMKRVEMNYDAKLITEYDRYLVLESNMNAMRHDYDKRLEDLEKHGVNELQKATTKYEGLLHTKKLQLEESQDEMTHQARVHEQMTAQIEDDADHELLEIRTTYETLLHKEIELKIRLKGEAGMMRNRYMASQKEVDELKRQVHRVQSEYSYFQKSMQELEKDKEDLRKEIDERDLTVQNRELQIYELKRRNQELEKFKFVLNYKITELKNQIEPRDQEIRELKEKIRDMETELVNLHKTNVSLELQLYELREKLGAARREQQNEMHRNNRCQKLLKRIRVDLLDASGLVQDPEALKAAVTKLYHMYSSSDEFLRSRKADLDAQCEFNKQRDHLERTIASLRKQVFQGTSSGGKGIDKTMEENVTLLTELNVLREDLENARKHMLHMEGLLGLAAKDIKPSEAKKKLENACYGYEELQDKYKVQMQECQSIINALKDDMFNLMCKLLK
ncbi:cilia- and flagella-associated protein 57 [Colletes gigas]|uniref:cilia- and flagella-associated protein 57 n=1 Tax=Colletes gigas TaxID=935657 RepID=UPI001C9B0A13|nr:cilia- and flagella-associated protein 57 [Colletes gigas]